MAVPARIDSRMSLGCLQLIREGAVLVRNADDVLEAMSELLPPSARTNPAPAPSREVDPETPRYSVEEALVMTNLDDEGVSMDELVRLTKLPVEKVNALAMSLRIKGFVRFLPGNRISPLTARR
jgi:DNA processing protein